ncbi:MAG: 50S ribosomal protein L11 [archaeon]
MKIKLLIDGGDMKPGPAVAQQLGPMGVNMGKVISEVNTATSEFKGMKVPVEIDINEKTKEFTIHTSSPPTSELLKKEIGLEKGSAKISETKVGNASIEDIIKIAKIKHSNMLEKDLKSAVKSVLGTCASIGVLVESKEPNELIEDVNKGKFDAEISEQRTETPIIKRKKLDNAFNKVEAAQEAKAEEAKAEEAAKAAEEAKPTEGEVPAEGGAAPEAGKEGETKPAEAKEEDKPKEKK